MAAADVEYRCFVGGLAWATDDMSLERAFSQWGEVTESKVRLASIRIRNFLVSRYQDSLSDLYKMMMMID